jgi:3-deoxy-manno-octulosonate cytidylyltransferase (CMP-KDO synthetase)
MPDFRVVIPARFGSSRLVGKPLLTIAGMPMIQHVWMRASESGARDVLVATDDERIVQAVEAFGGRAMMTRQDHASGTDRLAEVVRRAGFHDDDIIVNLQGDEPQIRGTLLSDLAQALAAHPSARASTMAAKVTSAADLFNPNVVKVVLDAEGFGLYFSRAPIPWVRGAFALDHPVGSIPAHVPFLRHLGLYAYRASTLTKLASAPVAPLESAESLEQLRMLHLGMRIHVTVLAEAPAHGVDTPEDLARVEAHLSGRGQGTG